jgi:hypothetical protein
MPMGDRPRSISAIPRKIRDTAVFGFIVTQLSLKFVRICILKAQPIRVSALKKMGIPANNMVLPLNQLL